MKGNWVPVSGAIRGFSAGLPALPIANFGARLAPESLLAERAFASRLTAWIGALLAAFLFLGAPSASAATLLVNGSGILTGATGVNVDGKLYNVSFVDGSCVGLYNGCNEVSDFTFQTQASALLAGNALASQVLIDGSAGSFDSKPDKTAGCTFNLECHIFIPYGIFASSTPVQYKTVEVLNSWWENADQVTALGASYNAYENFANASSKVYVIWTPGGSGIPPIPEPATWATMILGFGFIGGAMRRSRKGQERNSLLA